MEKVFRLGELFCGPGGLAYGLIHIDTCTGKYRIEHAWANDIDVFTCQTYRQNICPDTPDTVVCCDVAELDLEKLSLVDAMAFGFPCNDFSVVGKRKGIEGHFGPLYKYCVAAVEHFKPEWFIAENVSGLKSSNAGRTFVKILDEFATCGYALTAHQYHFEDYGIPQTRHRIIVVGIRSDLDVKFRVPSPEPYTDIDNTCRCALTCPPIAKDAANNELTRHPASVVERLNHIKPGENVFTASLPPELQLNVQGAKISQIYKRLDPDKPSYTITGSGGGGTHVYHWAEPRALTNRERARLQTFPDDFVFAGSKESVRKQIGMAVPPKAAQIIGEAILKSFASEAYPAIESNIALA
ncbi:MAG: DNA cytosine methyltransferase [Eggerthellaceae bacterium]|nr:DNA cytosine methyltransferase [Eggerthellaceae bacterium]